MVHRINKVSPGESKNGNEIRLIRRVGMFQAAAQVTGIIIGSGIFISPYTVLEEAGSPGIAVIMWAVTGIIAYLGAISMAELAVRMPDAGGQYWYLRQGWGDVIAFCFIYITFLFITPGSMAGVALTFAKYLNQLFFSGACIDPLSREITDKLVATLAIMLLAFINCINMNWAVKATDIFSSCKLMNLLILTIAGFASFWIPSLSANSFENISIEKMFSQNSPTQFSNYIFSFIAASWAYGGCQRVLCLAEEIKQPLSKTIPGSITMGFGAITTVYILTNLAYLIVLSPAELLSSEAVAGTFGVKIWNGFIYIVPFFVAISTFGSLNSTICADARQFLSGSRHGRLFSQLKLLNIYSATPVLSILSFTTLSVIYIWSESLTSLIREITYIRIIFEALVVMVLLKIRLGPHFKALIRKLPKKISEKLEISEHEDIDQSKEPEFSVHLAIPIIYCIAYAFIIIFPAIQNPAKVWKGLLLGISGVPIYFLLFGHDEMPDCFKRFNHEITLFCQKLFFCLEDNSKLE